MTDFQWAVPCDPSDLVYFRQRIGEAGVQHLLKVTVQLHGDKAKEAEVVVDTNNDQQLLRQQRQQVMISEQIFPGDQ